MTAKLRAWGVHNHSNIRGNIRLLHWVYAQTKNIEFEEFGEFDVTSNFFIMTAKLRAWGVHNHSNIRGKFTSDPKEYSLWTAISKKNINFQEYDLTFKLC